MDIETTEYKRCIMLKTTGRIDGSNAPDLSDALNAITDSGKYNIVFDMTDINFMASAGWWVLIDIQKTCKRFNRGELVLAKIDPEIRASLDLVGMGTYFQIYDDVTAAVAHF